MSPLPTIAATLLALGAVEATAYWWMHPAPAGLNQPVLVYQPSEVKAEKLNTENFELATSSADSSTDHRSLITDHSSPSAFSSTTTPLPAVVEKALPTLRCSTGTAARIDRDDGTTIHLAFFEWNLSDSTNVLEAFKHLPDECMGSIGMTLVSKEKPRFYTVKAQQDALAQSASSSSSNQQSPINNHQSGISPTAETLWFDHTVFRDAGGITVHAFKGTWVSGASSLIGDGFRGGADQWTQLRWKSALKRFHPAHARVAQGAVRGIPNPDFAWQAFEDAMLKDLKFQ
ncbi:MAG: hypothetical protein V4819_12510 [Verrucomicrobiota bacterium]